MDSRIVLSTTTALLLHLYYYCILSPFCDRLVHPANLNLPKVKMTFYFPLPHSCVHYNGLTVFNMEGEVHNIAILLHISLVKFVAESIIFAPSTSLLTASVVLASAVTT